MINGQIVIEEAIEVEREGLLKKIRNQMRGIQLLEGWVALLLSSHPFTHHHLDLVGRYIEKMKNKKTIIGS
jgi:hypothetical protein